MLRYTNYNIVFQEIPGEVTLAINISNCPNRCKGCHSPYLWEDAGYDLNENSLLKLYKKYCNAITCICFMGGDANPAEVEKLSRFLKEQTSGKLKTGWYSGKEKLPDKCTINNFNYIKLGAYNEDLGGLNSKNTNQRFYCIEDNKMTDITFRFQNKLLQQSVGSL